MIKIILWLLKTSPIKRTKRYGESLNSLHSKVVHGFAEWILGLVGKEMCAILARIYIYTKCYVHFFMFVTKS